MASLNPATFKPRFVKLRQAIDDGVLTKPEVQKFVAPFIAEAKKDRTYRKTLSELQKGSTKNGDGSLVRSTRGAQTLLMELLAKPTTPGRVTITAADDGKTIRVQAGQDVKVALPTNPATGYSWKVVKADRTFGFPKEKYIPHNPRQVGSSGLTEFVWKTNDSESSLGRFKTVLRLVRAFDGTGEQTFSFTANVVK